MLLLEPIFWGMAVLSGEAAKNALRGLKMDDVKTPSITEMRKRKFAYQIGGVHENGAVADSFFEKYSGDQSYEDVFEDAFNAQYLVDFIKAVWGAEPPYKLLD